MVLNPVVRVNIDDIRQDIMTYLQQVEQGTSLVVFKAGKPVAEITPVDSTAARLRPYGLCAGEFSVPDNFDDPLPEDVLHAFEGQ